MKNVSWLFLGLSTVAQLKVFKGYVCVCFFFFTPHPPEHLCLWEERSTPTREIHEEDLHRSDAGEESRKTTQFNAGEDQVPLVVVDGLIGGEFDGLISTGFDMGSRWCWVRLRLVMGLICVCWVDLFDRLLGLIGCICWVWLVWFGFFTRVWFFFFFFFTWVWFIWFWFHCFDLLIWWVCWVSRTWIVMFWEEYKEHEERCVEGKKHYVF